MYSENIDSIFDDIDEYSDNDDKIRKSLFGGYAKNSVDSYISNLEQSMTQMKINLEFQIKELVREKEGMTQENQLLKAQFNDIEEKEKKLQEDYSHLTKYSKETIELLDGLKNEKMELIEKIRVINSELNEKEEIIKHKMSLLKDKEGEIKSLQDKLDTSLTEATSNKEKYELEIELKDKETLKLKEIIEGLSEKLETCDFNLISSLEEEIRNLSNERQMNQHEISNLKAALETSMSKEVFNKQEEENKQQLMNKDKMIEDLNKRLDELNIKLEDDEKERNKIKEEYTTSITEIRDSNFNNREKEIDQLKAKIRYLENECGELIYKKTYMESENEKLKDENLEYNGIRAKFDILYGQFTDSKEEIEKLNIDKELLEDNVREYKLKEREYIFLKKTTDAHREKVHSLESDLKDVIHQVDLQSETIQDLMIKYQEEQAKNLALLREKTSLQSANVDLIEELGDLHKDLVEINLKDQSTIKNINNNHSAKETNTYLKKID